MADRLKFASAQKDGFTLERAFADGMMLEVYSPKIPATTAEETQFFWEVETLDARHASRNGYAPTRAGAMRALRAAYQELNSQT